MTLETLKQAKNLEILIDELKNILYYINDNYSINRGCTISARLLEAFKYDFRNLCGDYLIKFKNDLEQL